MLGIRKPKFTLIVLALVLVLAVSCAPAAVPVAPPTDTAAPAAVDAPTATLPPTLAPTDTAEPPAQEASPTTPPEPTATTESAASASTAQGQTWVIVPGEARYIVQEQLVNIDLPVLAIGRTNQVSGSVVLLPDGSIDAGASKFVVNMASLQTDRSQRDNFVRNNVLQTGQFPEATFVPTSINGLSLPLPGSGDLSFQLTGDLTIRNVTKSVTWDVKGTIDGGKASGVASTVFQFADFSLTQPRVPIVLSIEDKITLEIEATIELQ